MPEARSYNGLLLVTPSPSHATKNTGIVILPTYNEAENLPLMVEQLLAQPLDVLVVDDGSPDGTGGIADGLARDHPDRVSVIHRSGKMGLGSAYIAGFKQALAAGYAYILEMDCDFSHDPAYLPKFLEAIQHADVVLGSRYIPGAGIPNWNVIRRMISRGGNIYARTILGLPYQDLTGGFKCYRRKVLETLNLQGAQSNGYSFQIELTYRAHQHGFRITEIPIIFHDRRVGTSKMSRNIVVEAMVKVWRMKFSKG